MHIKIIDDKLILYLNQDKIKNINFHNEIEIENYFRNLFITLKDNYNICINGYYDIIIYRDKYYGIVLEMEKEDIDYLDIFDNQIEMKIKIKEDTFLYNIEDYFFLSSTNNLTIYSYKNKLYIKINSKLPTNDYLKLIENSNIIYGNIALNVINKGKKINM